jgi:hypothetical protein
MAFLTEAELKTRAHLEIITAITRDDSTIVPIIISESISLMKGYLSSRYDVGTIFQATGVDRDEVVLKMLKDIVLYAIYSLGNPQMMTKIVKDNFEAAMDWLKGVQSQKINPDLPVMDASNPVTYVRAGSNPRRKSHY